MLERQQPRVVAMRDSCRCGEHMGIVVRVGTQDTVRCIQCDRFQYNASRAELGERPVTVQTTHAAIRPRQRSRILARANGRCEVCGAGELLQVGHIVSVAMGLELGLTERELNDDENLLCLCAECNLGMGAEPMPLRMAVTVLRARLAWAEKERS